MHSMVRETWLKATSPNAFILGSKVTRRRRCFEGLCNIIDLSVLWYSSSDIQESLWTYYDSYGSSRVCMKSLWRPEISWRSITKSWSSTRANPQFEEAQSIVRKLTPAIRKQHFVRHDETRVAPEAVASVYEELNHEGRRVTRPTSTCTIHVPFIYNSCEIYFSASSIRNKQVVYPEMIAQKRRSSWLLTRHRATAFD